MPPRRGRVPGALSAAATGLEAALACVVAQRSRHLAGLGSVSQLGGLLVPAHRLAMDRVLKTLESGRQVGEPALGLRHARTQLIVRSGLLLAAQ
jgi:hypothetical protein